MATNAEEREAMGNEAEVDLEKQQWDDKIVSPTDVHDSEKSQVSLRFFIFIPLEVR